MSMTIEAKGKKFIVDDYFKEMTESEVEELKQSLGSCNWNNFNDEDTLHFQVTHKQQLMILRSIRLKVIYF